MEGTERKRKIYILTDNTLRMTQTGKPMESDMKEIQARIDELWKKQQVRKSLVNHSGPEERILKLKRMLHWFQDNRTRIHEAVSGDFKKPLEEVDLTEIWMNTTEIRSEEHTSELQSH